MVFVANESIDSSPQAIVKQVYYYDSQFFRVLSPEQRVV
jgi:hypothetical protein